MIKFMFYVSFPLQMPHTITIEEFTQMVRHCDGAIGQLIDLHELKGNYLLDLCPSLYTTFISSNQLILKIRIQNHISFVYKS